MSRICRYKKLVVVSLQDEMEITGLAEEPARRGAGGAGGAGLGDVTRALLAHAAAPPHAGAAALAGAAAAAALPEPAHDHRLNLLE